MEFIDGATLRMETRAALPSCPHFQKMAKELRDPRHAITTSESQEGSSGVAGEGDTIVHDIAGDLCLT